MSRYLIDQIERNPRIIVTPRTQITALLGKDQLEGVELLDTSRQQTTAMAVRGLFVFIGAQPSTRWLAGQLAEDSRGFLLAGANIPEAQLDDRNRLPCSWKPARPGSSPSATSAAGQSSGQRPQSGKARWRCGSCSNASRPPEVPSQTRPAPTATAAMPLGHDAGPEVTSPASEDLFERPPLSNDVFKSPKGGAATMTVGPVAADGRGGWGEGDSVAEPVELVPALRRDECGVGVA